jgi:hypothetical protein
MGGSLGGGQLPGRGSTFVVRLELIAGEAKGHAGNTVRSA